MRALHLVDTLLNTLIDIHSFIPMTWPTHATPADDAEVLTWEGGGNVRVLTPTSADHIGSALLAHLTGTDAAYTFRQAQPDRQAAVAALEALEARPAIGELAVFLRAARIELAEMEGAA